MRGVFRKESGEGRAENRNVFRDKRYKSFYENALNGVNTDGVRPRIKMKFLDRFKRKPRTEPPPPDYLKALQASKGEKPPAESQDWTPATPASKSTSLKGSAETVKRPSEHELKLELGDFLHRIPAHLLLPGPHDLKTELFFDMGELATKIANGQTTLPLAEIYRRVPTIFRGQILESDNLEIRFPWQKLARLVGMPNSGTGGAADTALAEKIRSKMPSPPPPESTDSAVKPPSVRMPKPQPDSTAPKPANADMTSVPPPPATMKLQMPAAQAPTPQPQPRPEPPKQEPPPPTLAEDLKKTALPDEAQRRIAEIRGDFERQLADAHATRRAIAEARDRAIEDAQRLQKEIDRLSYELASEQSGASAAQELLQRQKQQHAELQERVTALTAELDALKSSPPPAPVVDETRITALTAENESLQEQIARLSAMLEEAKSRPALPNAASQRHLDELQRRITGLEAAQKEAALELQREKEAKGKTEKLLANAERVLRESALHMEATKQEIRKEMEIGFRKQLREMEDQLRETEAELSGARASAAQLQPPLPAEDPAVHMAPLIAQFEADIENYRERIKTVIRERDEARQAAAKGPDLAEIEARDNELRQAAERIRNLEEQLATAQSIRDQYSNLQEKYNQLHTEYSGHKHHAEFALSELDTLASKMRDERQQFENNLTANSERSNAEISRLQQELSAVATRLSETAIERDELKSLADRLNCELGQLRETARQAGESSELATQLADTRSRLEETAAALAAREQKLAATLDEQNTLRATIAELESMREVARQAAEKAGLLETERAELSARLAEMQSGLTHTALGRDTLNEQLGRLSAERDMLAAERDQLATDLGASRRQNQEAATAHEAERSQLLAANEQSAAQLDAITQTRNSLEENLRQAREAFENAAREKDQRTTALERELSDTESRHLSAIDALKSELAMAAGARDEAIDKLAGATRQLQEQASEFDSRISALDRSHTAELQAAREALGHQLDAAQADARKQIEAAAQERDALQERFQSKLTEAHQLRAASEQERDAANAKSAVLEQELANIRQRMEAELAGTENARAALAGERDGLSMRIAALEQEIKDGTAAFDARTADIESEHRAAIAGMEAAFRDERQRITEAHNAALSDAGRRESEALASAKRELEQMHFTTETLQSELAVARKMHIEVVSGLDRERAQFATDREALEEKLRDVESSRAEVLGCMSDREKAIETLTARIQEAAVEIEDQRRELEVLRQEGTELKGRAGSLSSELADARSQLDRAEARSNETAAALEKLATELDVELARHEESQRDSAQEIARLERELARIRDQRDVLQREKDDLTRRIAQLTDQQKRMLDDFAAGIGGDLQQPRPVPHTSERTASVILPANPIIIDVTPEDGSINLPRIRPVPVRPPQVNVQ
jgi:chromosome segregation ATPase